ncbi:MAG: transposase [Pseudomonadota bacterium]
MQIIFLPPYSPNLNLIERLWRFLKKNRLIQSVLRAIR